MRSRYRRRVTASASPQHGAGHPLAAGASPAAIRQRLAPEDAQRFLHEYQRAIDEARVSLDLTTVHEVTERWRRIAILQTDAEGYRRTVRRAAELATGSPSPDDEPLEVTKRKAGL
jgi:hypothetical protein